MPESGENLRDTLARLAGKDASPDAEYDPFAAEKYANPVARNILAALATLPQRAIQNSQFATTTGHYDPAVPVEAAMMAMTGGVAGTGPGGVAIGSGPIRAYHSSPHDFDRFDLAKIGTGEGAQMYGHGLYFAENPAVSGQGGQYWNQFTKRFEGPEYLAADKLKKAGFDREAAIALAQKDHDAVAEAFKYGTHPPGLVGQHDPYTLESITKNMLYDRQAQLELLKSGKPVGPRTYEVNINADPAHMLDWDKAFPAQPQAVQEALRRSGIHPESPGPMGTKVMSDLPTGPMAERALRDPKSLLNRNLDKSGIPGIKYLDEGSRGVPGADAFRVGQPYTDIGAGLFRKGNEGWYVTPKPGVANTRALKEYGPFKTEAEAAAVRAAEPWRSSNYVIRDPAKIDIRKKYGIAAGLPVAGAGAAAATGGKSDEGL